MPNVAELLTAARQQIAAGEARLLLGEILQQSSAWLISHDDAQVGEEHCAAYTAWVTRRVVGEPIAYLIGRREFFGRDFHVAPGVLIPRPETELLVETALTKVSHGRTGRPSGRRCPAEGAARVLDLGTGSGCIAISIALERPLAQVTAVDFSDTALAIAERNRVALSAGTLRLRQSHWYSALPDERFDLIVGNPPYIATGDPHLAQGDLRHEPADALASGSDGLDDLRCIIGGAGAHLEAGGELWLEHGYDQAAAVRDLFAAAGFDEIGSRRDLAGIERISGGRWPAQA